MYSYIIWVYLSACTSVGAYRVTYTVYIKYLSAMLLCSVCRQAESVIEASTAVKLSDLVKLFQDLPACDDELATQLLESFSVLLLRQRNEAVVINLEELVMSPDSLTTLLALNSSCSTQVSSTTLPKPHNSRRLSSKCGRPTHRLSNR